jgi:hypothetical protein
VELPCGTRWISAIIFMSGGACFPVMVSSRSYCCDPRRMMRDERSTISTTLSKRGVSPDAFAGKMPIRCNASTLLASKASGPVMNTCLRLTRAAVRRRGHAEPWQPQSHPPSFFYLGTPMALST